MRDERSDTRASKDASYQLIICRNPPRHKALGEVENGLETHFKQVKFKFFSFSVKRILSISIYWSDKKHFPNKETVCIISVWLDLLSSSQKCVSASKRLLISTCSMTNQLQVNCRQMLICMAFHYSSSSIMQIKMKCNLQHITVRVEYSSFIVMPPGTRLW